MGLRCNGNASHQVLEDSVQSVEIPGSIVQHVFLELQVSDGEIEGELCQDRCDHCNQGEKRLCLFHT